MAPLRISVPGKSFLAGEYLALKEGPTLVFTSFPRFELSVSVSAGTGKLEGIHADSPAGLWITKHSEFFKNYDLRFSDPHEGRGGWGASTAQFLTVFVFSEWRESCELETLKSLSISRLLEAYWSVAWNGEGVRPSGADLVAQYKGKLTSFEKRSGLISVSSWPFHEIDFALIATGHKLATHEHLRTLGDFNERGLEQAMGTIQQGLQSARSAQFVAGIQAYGQALQQLGFLAAKTEELLSKINVLPGVLAAKGCGALGADVMLVVYEKSRSVELSDAVLKLGLEIRATSKDLSHGLEIEVRNS